MRTNLNFNDFDNGFKEEILDFVGHNQDIYDRRWTNMGNRRNKLLSWHWPTFFVNSLWAGYRQHLNLAWIYLGIDIVFGLIDWIVPYLWLVWIDLLISLILSMFFALFSNYAYLQFVVKKVEDMRKTIPDREKRLAALKAAGGVRWSQFWLVLAISVVIKIMINFF